MPCACPVGVSKFKKRVDVADIYLNLILMVFEDFL